MVFWAVSLRFLQIVKTTTCLLFVYYATTLFSMSMIVIEIKCLLSGTEMKQPQNTGAQAHPMPTDPAVPHQQPQTKLHGQTGQ